MEKHRFLLGIDPGHPDGDRHFFTKIDMLNFFKPINYKKMNEKKTPHIGIDIETLSLRPTAAITAISFKTFFFDGTVDEDNSYTFCVDATSCAMYGLTSEQKTITWWANQPIEAKQFFLNSPSIKLKTALASIRDAYNRVRAEYGCSRLLVWTQGTDYDISVLRNAFRTVFDDSEDSIPWPHDCVRDARTYILSNLNLLNSVGFFKGFDPAYNPDRPYDVIPSNPGWVKHDADSDVLQMIHNLHHVTNYMLEAFNMH